MVFFPPSDATSIPSEGWWGSHTKRPKVVSNILILQYLLHLGIANFLPYCTFFTLTFAHAHPAGPIVCSLPLPPSLLKGLPQRCWRFGGWKFCFLWCPGWHVVGDCHTQGAISCPPGWFNMFRPMEFLRTPMHLPRHFLLASWGMVLTFKSEVECIISSAFSTLFLLRNVDFIPCFWILRHRLSTAYSIMVS